MATKSDVRQLERELQGPAHRYPLKDPETGEIKKVGDFPFRFSSCGYTARVHTRGFFGHPSALTVCLVMPCI